MVSLCRPPATVACLDMGKRLCNYSTSNHYQQRLLYYYSISNYFWRKLSNSSPSTNSLSQSNCHLTNSLCGLWNQDVQCRIHKDSPIIPILSRINPIPCIGTDFFKIHCNIVLPSTPSTNSLSESNCHLTNSLCGLWNQEVQCRIHKGSPIIPILSRVNAIPLTDTYVFKVHSNITLPSTPKPP